VSGFRKLGPSKDWSTFFIAGHGDENLGGDFNKFCADIAILGHPDHFDDTFPGLYACERANNAAQPIAAFDLPVKLVDTKSAQ